MNLIFTSEIDGQIKNILSVDHIELLPNWFWLERMLLHFQYLDLHMLKTDAYTIPGARELLEK